MPPLAAAPRPDERSVFLNVPFDPEYLPCFLALIAGLTAMGRTPRCTLEVSESGPDRRFERIASLLEKCGASVHDLSRVSLRRKSGFLVPRFNMPFELGLACMLARQTPHRIFILEEKHDRAWASLSDLGGWNIHVHGGTPSGVLACVVDCFDRPQGAPPYPTLQRIARRLSRAVREMQGRKKGPIPLSASTFRRAVEAAVELATAEGLISE